MSAAEEAEVASTMPVDPAPAEPAIAETQPQKPPKRRSPKPQRRRRRSPKKALPILVISRVEEQKGYSVFKFLGFQNPKIRGSCSLGRKGVKGSQLGSVLSWTQRVKITVGASKGLEYLHEKAHIIHRDIKSSNVLLFDDDVAKIADFDLSNQAPDMAARLHSTRVLRTFGYHAPEAASMKLSSSGFTHQMQEGQPKRHLLTTGWSVFVSAKGLLLVIQFFLSGRLIQVILIPHSPCYMVLY
ncbi:hypothetical protein MRB53_009131 [Persea americana]|uniref:Uncharacterized protein n=1 Tax=Persea americana TaxID=3435 RepID=A0ACC2LN57_PERAE|nr:hypothetical protein MRB53_009131 [Persea americana]